jgi:hypothetical protein
VAGIRQIVESVYDNHFNTFGLWRERPHDLQGLRSRLASRVALHNFCILPTCWDGDLTIHTKRLKSSGCASSSGWRSSAC